MIICISGFTATGKDSTADYIAKKLNLPRVNYTFKDLAKDKDISLIEFQKMASEDNGKIDKEFDKKLVKEAHRLNKEKGGCVVSTWISPWVLKDADFRIFIYAKEEEKAKRLIKRGDLKTIKEALEHIKKREENNRKRYKKYYNIDIRDLSIFDIIIDNSDLKLEQTGEKILKEIKKRNLTLKKN